MFAIVKGLRPTNDSGVILDVHWFREDPETDRDMQPELIDSLLLPVPDVASVTDAMIDEALDKRMLVVEAELAPQPQPRPTVRAMIGKARQVYGHAQGVKR